MAFFDGNSAIVASAAMCCAFLVAPAQAQDRHVDVPAQPAAVAIPELARQTGIQIVVREDIVRNERTTAVRGFMSAHEALDRLLIGTNLQAIAIESETFRIVA